MKNPEYDDLVPRIIDESYPNDYDDDEDNQVDNTKDS